MGATQKSQSCDIAQSPTNRATPVLRAGFTEVLVTGMLIRWISVRPRPMAIGAKPCGRALVGGAEDDEQEHHGHDHFGDQRRQQGVPAGRMGAVAVGREAGGHVKAGLAAGDQVQHAAGHHAAQDLCDDVGQQLLLAGNGRRPRARSRRPG